MSGPIAVRHDAPEGRIVTADSASYCDARVGARDVFVCGSFAGVGPIGVQVLPFGPRAVIAHACGVGKDGAAVAGISLCDRFGVPAAAIETMSARISDGASAWGGSIGHVNSTAAALGVAIGQSVPEAARRMLAAPPGRSIDVGDAVDNAEYPIVVRPAGGIYAIWNLLLLPTQTPRPRDVFCIASHSGKVMAERSAPIAPKGVISNDGGIGKDRSGIEGLETLGRAGIPAAAVHAMSARIGDARSTFHDGVLSAMNGLAAAAGLREGMPAHEAAFLLLDR